MRDFEDRLTAAGITISSRGECGEIESEICQYYEIAFDKIAQAWIIARDSFTNASPLIMPGMDGYINSYRLERIKEKSLARYLKSFEKFDAVSWFKRKWNEYLKSNSYDEDAINRIPFKQPGNKMEIADFIVNVREIPAVWLAIVPKVPSYLFPVYFGIGGNNMPQPHVLAGILRYWHHLYGAELSGFSYDAIEISVKNPPKDKAAASKLAQELFVFCDEIHSPRPKTVKALEMTLPQSTIWRCWWD